jgi:hypothetical protein
VVDGHLFSFSPVDGESLRLAELDGREKARVGREALRSKRSKAVYCSDGRVFASLTDAAQSFGVNRVTLLNAIKNGRPLSGVRFSRTTDADYQQLATQYTDALLKAKAAQVQAIAKPVLRSDGCRYASVLDAARAMSVSQYQMHRSLRTGKPRDGFTFSTAETR